ALCARVSLFETVVAFDRAFHLLCVHTRALARTLRKQPKLGTAHLIRRRPRSVTTGPCTRDTCRATRRVPLVVSLPPWARRPRPTPPARTRALVPTCTKRSLA